MTSPSFIVGIVGNIISILVFLSPVGTFKRVLKKKSTEDFKGLPYVSTLLSTSLWTFYGLLKPGGLLIVTVNGTGAVWQAIYVVLYLIFAPRDKRVKYLKLVAVLDIGCPALVISVVLLAIHGSIRLTVVGVLCAGLTLGMYASPLSVMVPNAIGFVLGSAQLILYATYKTISMSTKSTEKMEEEGSTHLVGSSLEMGEYKENDENKERNLSKGKSLPNTSVTRQHSLKKILKSHSLTPYELQSNWVHEDNQEVENGDTSTTHQT